MFLISCAIAGCGSHPVRESATRPAPQKSAANGHGGYYQNDGPGANPPTDLDRIPEAVPRAEPLHRFANRPYSVLGRDYVPLTAVREYRERGVASWYGRQFHGQKTAIGESYDMYGMTAAHPTLPLPCYVRVTSAATGRSVIVRVNDRGPFYSGRVIDLSYAAAQRIGIAQRGSGEVTVELIVPGTVLVASAPPPVTVAATAASPPPVVVASTAPAAAPESAAPPLRDEADGIYLQLGAFANYANAENFLRHVESQVVWLGERAAVNQREGYYRVQMGPYPDRQEARRVGELVKDALALAPALSPTQ